MMSSVNYSRVPLSDSDNTQEERTSAFDFSSPFTYEKCEKNSKWKNYNSVFTYSNSSTSIQIEDDGKDVSVSQFATDNLARLVVMFGFFIVYLVTFPVLVWFSFKRIKDHERFVVFRLGRLQKCSGPGIVFLLPLLDKCHKIDIRLKAFSVPPKQIITGDGAIIEVGADIYFQIVDAKMSVTNVQDLNRSTRVLLQTSLCNNISKKTLSEIQAERRSIAETVMKTSNETCIGWGVEIHRAELSQIKILSEPPPKSAPTLMMPPGLMDAMAAGAVASAGTGVGAGGGKQDLPSALMQLVTAVMSKKGPDQSEAISEAFKAFSGASMPPVESPAMDMNKNEELDAACQRENQKAVLPEFYTRDEIIASIRNSLSEDLVQKVGAVYQFDISGDQGGIFYLDLLNGSGAIGTGESPTGECNIVLTLNMEDLQAMLKGQLQPFHAYMSGRLKVSGDTRTAMKLEELVDKMRTPSQSKGLQIV